MHYGAINGHARLVESLITRGYKVDARDSVCPTYLFIVSVLVMSGMYFFDELLFCFEMFSNILATAAH